LKPNKIEHTLAKTAESVTLALLT